MIRVPTIRTNDHPNVWVAHDDARRQPHQKDLTAAPEGQCLKSPQSKFVDGRIVTFRPIPTTTLDRRGTAHVVDGLNYRHACTTRPVSSMISMLCAGLRPPRPHLRSRGRAGSAAPKSLPSSPD